MPTRSLSSNLTLVKTNQNECDSSCYTKLWRSIASVYQVYNLTEKAVRHRSFSRIFVFFCTYALWEKIAMLALRNFSNLLSSVITNRVRVDVIVCVWSKLVQSLDFLPITAISLAQKGGLCTVVNFT